MIYWNTYEVHYYIGLSLYSDNNMYTAILTKIDEDNIEYFYRYSNGCWEHGTDNRDDVANWLNKFNFKTICGFSYDFNIGEID